MDTTSLDQLEGWLKARKEHQTLEFKEAKHQFDHRKLQEYCVAIANEGGGELLLGVSDRLPRRVVGSHAFLDPNKVAQELFNQLRFRVDVEEIHHPDGRVVIFHIPPRPKGTAYSIEGKWLMRSGEELVPMSEDRLRKIFSEGMPDWLEHPSKSGLSSQEVVEFLDTQTYFELHELAYPSRREGVLDRLLQDRLISQAKSGTFTISRLGALLLARRLEDFSDVSRKAPRVIAYSGTSKLKTRIDIAGAKGYAVGFQGLISFIMAQLPQNEVVEEALRREHKLVSELVIRELVANALIHQDFAISGTSVMVEIYDNRVEISSPGEPIVELQRFIDANRSRNERFADIMRRLRICEEKGSGIDKVVATIELNQLPAAAFGKQHDKTLVTIFGPRKFGAMQREDRIRACYQHACLKYVISEPMTNRSLRERFGLPEAKSVTISQIIAAAIEEGLIRPDKKAGDSKKLAR